MPPKSDEDHATAEILMGFVSKVTAGHKYSEDVYNNVFGQGTNFTYTFETIVNEKTSLVKNKNETAQIYNILGALLE